MGRYRSKGWIVGLLVVIVLILMVSRGRKSSTASFWMTDFEKAQKTAAAEDKDLFINFSGSDWCYWCKRLDEEVFSEPAFHREAGKYFVFMLVDFPNDKSHQSGALQKQNEQLAQRYHVEGFPTIILAEPNGLPYARTGYREGGVDDYLEHLKELRKQKTAP